MWGKNAPHGSGGGWSGWYRGDYFRSLMELAFMVQAKEEGRRLESGESGEFTIPYAFNGVTRTYRPDFYCPDSDEIVEIKPSARTHEPLFLAKKLAATEAYRVYRVVTETELTPVGVDKLAILVQNGEVLLLPKWQERLSLLIASSLDQGDPT